jgi:hypothetical protein
MHRNESSNRYFLINAGHPTAVVRPPADHAAAVTWRKWLTGSFAAMSLSTILVLLWASGAPLRPLEATVQMEQLAARVEQAAVVHPDTASEIARLMDQHGYDCTQVPCSAKLQARNNAARSRLEMLIATKTAIQGSAGIRTHGFVRVDPTVTGAFSAAASK